MATTDPLLESLDDLLVDRVDPVTGESLGGVSLARAQREKWCFATLHVWVLDDQGRLIFSRARAGVEGDQCDVTCARTSSSDWRGVKHTLGGSIATSELRLVGVDAGREHAHVFLWRSARALDSFHPADGAEFVAVPRHGLSTLRSGGTVTGEGFDGSRTREVALSGYELAHRPREYWDALVRTLDTLVDPR